MIAIEFQFPAGRYHATAWDSHVNEGQPDWPPSPWRLLRALVSTAYKLGIETREHELQRLVAKLGTQSPSYSLPMCVAAHTRHYMPDGDAFHTENNKPVFGPNKTKVFDTFIHVAPGQWLTVLWPVDLSADERQLLAELLASLNYLGRAESLVEAALLPPSAELSPANARPLEDELLPQRSEIVRLLAPMKAEELAAWLAPRKTTAGGGKKEEKANAALLAGSVFEALLSDNGDLKAAGWSQPPGSKWVSYIRPEETFQNSPRREPRRSENLPTVARFAITSKVQPSITQSLSLAERFHQALCSKLPESERSPALTGLDDERKPLTGNDHVYFLPECDAHGYVTHMTLHAKRGFDAAACRVLGRLRKVWGAEGFDVEIVLLATGQPADFTSTSSNASPYFRPARNWVSLTPFIPVRHAKSSRTGTPKLDPKNGLQIGSPEHDCWRLLKLVAPNLPEARVSPLGSRIRCGLRDIPCLDFQCQRRTGEGTRAGVRGYALRLDFGEDVSLPLGLGYASHFGLGLFVPVVGG